MKVTATFYYQGEMYTYDDEYDWLPWDDLCDAEYAAEWNYMEGNFSCDCNRSIFIGIPKLPCGNKIKLVSLVRRT